MNGAWLGCLLQQVNVIETYGLEKYWLGKLYLLLLIYERWKLR